MNRFAKLLTLAFLAGLAGSAVSATVTGKWNGHFAAKLVRPADDKQYTPEKVKDINGLLGQIKIILTIRADGTYLVITKGPGQPDASTKGKWKLKGKTLTLTPDEKRAGEVGTVGSDGKTLTMSLPPLMVREGVKGRTVFVKS